MHMEAVMARIANVCFWIVSGTQLAGEMNLNWHRLEMQQH